MMHVNTGGPYTLAKSTICYYLATSQCLPLFSMQPPFEVSIGQYDIGKWLYGFMESLEHLSVGSIYYHRLTLYIRINGAQTQKVVNFFFCYNRVM